MGAFANDRPQVVRDFGPDPRERYVRSLLGDLIARAQGFRTTVYAVGGNDPGQRFDGYAAAPQSFRGLNSGVGASTIIRDGGSATIDSGLVEGPMGDPSRRLFSQRLQRRGYSS